MKIGDKIYLVPKNTRARYSTEKYKTVTVKSIGRKYFKVEEMPNDRFFIEKMKHDGGSYSSCYDCYLSLEVIEEEKERGILRLKIGKLFSYNTSLSLTQLRAINAIVENNEST
ncbi:hypothetical protein Phi17218_027 [Cellulophaga phage phi17:2_18]|uniref:Uncharacterized protein n=2 Tax=Lightbulbvirus Cba172 TaxID=1918525 RepID=R9ZYK4_9CAUD|nr:hypothetical protein Phi17:2_gp027 [Cellulophaga phage phi17:2]AGO47560.1 hypothetical protein Phi17:2_gp027 [Cellulophaga phage phi17:2]ALO80430.1 hypothetical protein Phi17218_027 [Cellulophaga phage phi17:2_18]